LPGSFPFFPGQRLADDKAWQWRSERAHACSMCVCPRGDARIPGSLALRSASDATLPTSHGRPLHQTPSLTTPCTSLPNVRSSIRSSPPSTLKFSGGLTLLRVAFRRAKRGLESGDTPRTLNSGRYVCTNGSTPGNGGARGKERLDRIEFLKEWLLRPRYILPPIPFFAA